MNSRRLIFALLLPAVWILSARSAPAQTTLRYKFKEGEQLRYTLDQKMKMTMNIMGNNIDIAMDQTSEMTWHVQTVDEKGNARVKIKFGRTKMNMNTPMGKTEVDSESTEEPGDQLGQILHKVVKTLGNLDVTSTVSALGEYSDIKIPEKVLQEFQNLPGGNQFGEMFTPDGLKRMVSQSGLIMPKEAVSVGKTWKNKNDMKLPFGKMVMETDYGYTGPTQKDGRTLEKISVTPKATIDPDPNAPVAMKLKSQKGTGAALFDNAAGQLVEVTNQQTMEMEVEAGGQTFTMNMVQIVTMRLAGKK